MYSYGEYRILVPPIKCQGIKTKLVPFIREKVDINDIELWIEPFVGTGVVAFNIVPERAILTDKNQYIIALYQGIQNGEITSKTVRKFLEEYGEKLECYGEDYYRQMREAFNHNGDPLHFCF